VHYEEDFAVTHSFDYFYFNDWIGCDMSVSVVFLIFLFGILIGAGAMALYADRRDLARRVSDLEKVNEKLRLANKSNLPFATAEEIENVLAGVVLLKNELMVKTTILENIEAHAKLARENKRAGESSI